MKKIFILKGDLKGSINKIVGIAKDKNILIQYVDKNKLDQIAQGGSHQGIAALVTPYVYFL